ncbi:MAG: MATE family efflux transporter [Bacteroidales bacterium]|nr:MATE family efflux transporter [Bacteroidales bacterium]
MKEDLTVGKASRQIFKFALPMLVGNVFQQAYNLVDSAVVGRYIGKQALAAVGASFPIIFLLISLIIGVATGATIMIAQFYGAGKMDKIKLTNSTLMIFLMAAAVVISFIGITWTREIFKLIQLPEELMDQASIYLQVYLLGLVFFFGYNGIAAVLRGLGDSKTPLYFLIMATLINIGLDLLFVIVFGFGVEGTAYATIISQGIAFIAAIIYLHRRDDIIQFKFKDLKFDKALYVQSIKIGLPSGLQATFVALGMTAVLGIVNTFGTDVVAGYSVAIRLDALATLPAMNFAAALTTFVGQNIGAGKMDRVNAGYRSTLLMSSIFSIVISIIFYFFGPDLMRLFTNQESVIKVGVEYLIIVSSFYVIFSAMFANNAVLRGAGDTLIPMIITLIALWVVRVPASYFLSQKYGEVGIWWSLPLAWIIGLIFSYAYYKTGRWKRKKVV